MAKTWLITGCSSGFGELFVRQLTALGDQVVATGRNAESRLAHLRNTGATILDLDVTAPQAEIDKKVQQALEAYGRIDVLVNNAGFIQCGAVEELTQEDLQLSLDTHLHGPMNLTRAVLPHFRDRGDGWLVYMSSQSGLIGEPGATGYCASKFALEGAVESLAKELAWLAPGIRPLLIEPGIFNTEVMRNIRHAPPGRAPFWQPLNEATRARAAGNYGRAPGDAALMVAKVIQVVRGESGEEPGDGAAAAAAGAGRPVPLRIPLGSDCLANLRDRVRALQQMCDDWEDVATSTDLPGAGEPMPAFPE
ncbi:hydroxybutyrate dehydrogenase [Xylariaceae sp. FL0804]|nr:hydroxybutyrate dehydrogenase [Xylariaceae sp. FL0804]